MCEVSVLCLHAHDVVKDLSLPVVSPHISVLLPDYIVVGLERLLQSFLNN